MSYSRNKVPLGAVLQQAGLISAVQVQQALKQQQQTNSGLKIGEILASQGRINAKTADFFAEQWFNLPKQPKQPIGQYLKQAALLNESQIQIILNEQKQTQQKFGELAIAKGWLKQTTLDFFLRYLNPHLAQSNVVEIPVAAVNSVNGVNVSDRLMTLPDHSQIVGAAPQFKSTEQLEYSQKIHEGFLQIKRKLLKIEGQEAYSEQILDRVLIWTGGQSFLTQKLFQLLSKNSESLIPKQEAKQIDYLVETQILHDWENNELGSHLKTIKDRLLNNQHCHRERLLRVYQQILAETVLIDQSIEQQELLNMGLVVKQQNKLTAANPIYQSVFNLSWATRELNQQNFDNSSPQPIAGKDKQQSVSSQTSASANNHSFFRLKNLVILLTLIGLLTIFFNNLARRMSVRLAFQKGNELLKQKSFSEAVDEYNRLLKLDSNYFQAWTNRGYALAGLQKYEQMRQSCLTATIIEPTAVYAWNCQGEALYNLKLNEQALVAFEQAIALDQSDPIFSINKSESLRALGKNEESLIAIQEAIKILEEIKAKQGKQSISGEFAVALTLLGNGYRQKEQLQDAISAYEQAVSYSPNYFPAQIGKGIALSKAKRYQEARVEFEQALENPQLTKTQQAQTWFFLGKTFCQSEQNSLGIDAFERSLKLNPDYEIAEEAKNQCR
ncbi:MAG: tetratricopeptide repeat protein [Pleurocapsa sp.]